jgi:DNA-binding CsgD family transcriptional regulator
MFDAFLDLGVAGYVLKENASAELIACLKAVAAGDPYVSPSLTRLLLRRRQAADQLRSERPGIDRLTPAERRILRLIAEDKTSKEIASHLGVSPNTVDNHRANICEKLGLRGTHSLLKFAFDNKSKPQRRVGPGESCQFPDSSSSHGVGVGIGIGIESLPPLIPTPRDGSTESRPTPQPLQRWGECPHEPLGSPKFEDSSFKPIVRWGETPSSRSKDRSSQVQELKQAKIGS